MNPESGNKYVSSWKCQLYRITKKMESGMDKSNKE